MYVMLHRTGKLVLLDLVSVVLIHGQGSSHSKWSAVVFKMHYSELIAKEEDVSRLKAIIQGLSGNK